MRKKMIEIYYDEKKDIVKIIETPEYKKIDATAKMDIREMVLLWTDEVSELAMKELTKNATTKR